MLFGPGGTWGTSTAPLAVGSGWQSLSFSLAAAYLVYVLPGSRGSAGTMNATDTLSDVSRILIRHDTEVPTPIGNHAPHVTATLDMDNTTAVPEPRLLLLVPSALALPLLRRR